MASVNKVIIVGRLGQPVELRQTQGGNQVASFSMATSEKFKDKQGQQQEQTEWHNITLWGKQAELAGQYLQKGSMVYIEGKLKTDSWEDNGVKKFKTSIVGNVMQFLDSKPQGQQQQQQSGGFGQQAPQQQTQQQPQQGFGAPQAQQQQQQQYNQPQQAPMQQQGGFPQQDELTF